jgi:hypothetical protein
MFKGLMKYPTCGASRYKRSDNYREEDNPTKIGNKRNKGGKKNVSTQCLEENTTLAVDGTNQRRMPTLVIYVVHMTNRLLEVFVLKPKGLIAHALLGL